ncbi:MAG: poly(A) polymerase [Bdellovibrionota bacterium]
MSKQSKPTLHQDWIDQTAFMIVDRLQRSGYESYLVGGCVRDLLVGIHPKDYDIATSALPDQVRRKVSNSYIIGRRFRLVLVKRGNTQYEVATFRRNAPIELPSADENADVESVIIAEEKTLPAVSGDNFFGTAKEDAQRRDFTLNALFYDPIKKNLIDYCAGLEDIEKRIIKVIGNPTERFIEDPIRILRAIRLAHKLNFSLEHELRAASASCSAELKKSALPRRREEYLKIMKLAEPHLVFSELFDLNILEAVLPSLHQLYQNKEKALIFEQTLIDLKKSCRELTEPVELFSILAFCYLHAMAPEFQGSDLDAISENPVLTKFFRDELGMFKLEVSLFFKILDLKSSLLRKDLYLRKGDRRKKSFLSNECLPLSLIFAYQEGSIPTYDFYFWLKEQNGALESFAQR